VLFSTSVASSAFWREMTIRRARNEAAEEQQKRESLRAAQDIISSRGLLAFTEPLKPGQADALIRYLDGHPDMPASDLLRVSERYQDVGLMRELALMRLCPPEALKIIFDKTVKNNERPVSGLARWAVDETFLAIAHRENTPPEVLGKLMSGKLSPEVRLAAR